MKIKHLALLVAMLLCGISAFAEQPQSKADKTVEFRPYWDLQLQGGAGYTIGEASFGDLVSPAVYLSTNYRFHHAMGIRLGLGGYQGKGAVLTNSTNAYSFNFLQLNADYKLDLTSLIGGFNHKRVCGVYVFAGVAGVYGFDNKQAAELKPVVDAYHNEDTMPYLWDSKFFVAGRFGLGLDFRVSDMVTLNLEGNTHVLSDRFNSKRAADRNTDWQFNLLAGVSVSFGKKYDVSKKWLAEEEARKAAELAGADAMFYPDEGAMKRYSDSSEKPYAFGLKKRDWQTGKILGLNIINADNIKDKNVLIVDDICSRGGTFYHSAKALKAAGAKSASLYITHCEETITLGELAASDGLVDHVYTTRSIFPEKLVKKENGYDPYWADWITILD